MSSLQEIHQSVIDANDIEDVHEQEISVADVFVSLLRHPFQIFRRWNWKSALIGAILRASFYFGVYKATKEGIWVTLAAVFVEFCFRFFTSGISGSLVQSFRKATPEWAATLIISVSLPTMSHIVEYFTHLYQEQYFSSVFPASENNGRTNAFAISVLFSVVAALFNIFIMRHGVMIVGAGEESKSLGNDLKQMPRLILEFITVLPNRIIEFLGQGKFIYALGVFLGFGFAVGSILGFFRGKWSWARNTTIASLIVLLVWTILVFAFKKLTSRNRD